MLAARRRKVRTEQAVRLERSGVEYEAYRREVRALVPLLL